MKDLEHTERLLNLIYIIQKTPGIQARELAEIFGKTTRTIQRDISSLRKMGFSIISSTGAAGGFASRGSYYLKPLIFTGEEALAIFVAARILLGQNGFPYISNLKSALEKISQVISAKDERFFRGLEPKTSIIVKQLKDYYPWGSMFAQINQAILDQSIVQITYDSFSGQAVTSRSVNPYHMLFREGCWYLIGYCHLRGEVRIFRFDRIISLEVTAEKFRILGEFSLGDYFEKSWQLGKGEQVVVKVRFDPPISRLIRENIWHQTQKLEEIEDDSLIFTVCVEGTWEIKKWILSWGAGAVCLEPDKLREEIQQEMFSLLKKYKDIHT